MERRELLLASIGGLATAIVPKWILPLAGRGRATGRADHFSSLWREAHLALYFSDYRRACDLFEQARIIAAGLDTDRQADSLEMLIDARGRLEQQDGILAEDRKEAERDPENLSKRLQLAERLHQVGRYDEAAGQFQTIMRRADEVAARENFELWPRIGRYHYRGQRYGEAAQWFERTPESLGEWEGPCGTPEEYLLRHIAAEPTLDRLLVSLALGKKDSAHAAAKLYVSKLGRLPWPYRLFLAQADIDADAIYIEMHGGAA